MTAIRYPHGHWHLTLGAWSILIDRRAVLLFAGLALAWFALLLIALSAGSARLTPLSGLRALTGNGSPAEQLLVLQLRLPRALAASLAGSALGMAGCLIQAMTRNRLATPDVIGLNDGAALGLLMALTLGFSNIGPWWVAPLGAGLTALVLWLAAGGLGLNGNRLIIAGIGVAGLVRALSEWLLSFQNLQHASAIYLWSIGSLQGVDIQRLTPMLWILALSLPWLVMIAPVLRLLLLNNDTQRTLGALPESMRGQLFALAIGLSSLAIAVVGPIGFIALAAPVLVTGLARPGDTPVVNAGLCGAILLLLADTVGKSVSADANVPAGVMTSLLGGPFLLWVLFRQRSTRNPR